MEDKARQLAVKERATVAEVVASVLRHDLRNRLASVRNASFYLASRLQGTQPWREDARLEQFFGLMERELDEAERLLGAHEARAPEDEAAGGAVRLGELAEEALHLLRPAGAVRVERRWEDSEPVALDALDGLLMARCVLENALEALPEGGTVWLRTWQDAEWVRLAVEDSGPGLAPEVAERAFEPYVTTKPGRAGLGLCIARRLALRHGARVALQPREGGGTRVELRFARLVASTDSTGQTQSG